MWFTNRPECNHDMGAPKGMESNVETLRVHAHEEDLGRGPVTAYTSFWQPNAEDLAILNAGGVVALTVFGVHPVLRMEVKP